MKSIANVTRVCAKRQRSIPTISRGGGGRGHVQAVPDPVETIVLPDAFGPERTCANDETDIRIRISAPLKSRRGTIDNTMTEHFVYTD